MLKAVVTPKLCVPLLLGLPFLSINHIVADFKLCSAIDKTNDYDLLNPPVPKTQKKLSEARMTVVEAKMAKKQVLSELVKVCKQCLTEGRMVLEVIKPLDVAGMIKNQIEILSFQQKVGDIEKADPGRVQ